MFLLIDNYDSFTYNLKAVFENLGEKVRVIKNDVFIKADDYEGIILSPGPSSPENSGTTLKYLEKYTGEKPFFGVCLGMQSICYSLGYKIVKARTIMHGKKDIIIPKNKSVIFNNIQKEFVAVRYHSLVVSGLEEEYITAIAKSDNEIMGYEDESKGLFGVQFHPESYLSELGEKIVQNYIDFCRK
jgi:anthranilate synthase component 2